MLPAELYDYLPCIFGAVFLLLGLYMAIFPQKATRKDLRDNPEAVNKNKKAAIVYIICGVVMFIVGIL